MNRAALRSRSPQAFSTALRSSSLVKRCTTSVPSWLRTSAGISRGRCVARIVVSPYLRPSLAISPNDSSFTLAYSSPMVRPRNWWASSSSVIIGLSRKVFCRARARRKRPITFIRISRVLCSNRTFLKEMRRISWSSEAKNASRTATKDCPPLPNRHSSSGEWISVRMRAIRLSQ